MDTNSEKERLDELLLKYSNIDYINNLEIHVGQNNHEETVKGLTQFGKKVMFCTGTRAMRNYGFLTIYNELFKKHGLNALHYDNISSNPTLKQMKTGVKKAKEFQPDVIFALGGGSVIDTSKVIAVSLNGDVWDYVEKKKELDSGIPIVASSTTSGTGSHVTPYAVVTNTDTLEKKTLKNTLLLPKKSYIDLDIIRKMPDQVIATTGFDVLCHAAEVYTRDDCTTEAAEFCEAAFTSLREHLIASYNGDGINNKLGMIYADIFSGIALTLIGTHVPHAISHPISARFPEVNHGQSLAYVMAETSKKQIENGSDTLKSKYEKVSRLLGGNGDFVRTIFNYMKLLDLDKTKQTFNQQDCELIFLDTLGYRKGSVKRSPAPLSKNDIREIIYNSLEQR